VKDAESGLCIDGNARCVLAKIELTSAPLQLGALDPKAKNDEHADRDAECGHEGEGTAPAFVDVGLFAASARLQRIEVQIAAARGRARRRLNRAAGRIDLPR
jgi:hypothetical protein